MVVTERDIAFNLKKLDEYNTFCEVIRLMYTCGTESASSYAAVIDKIIACIKQGRYAYTAQDIKRLCNAAKRMK